MVEKYFRYNSSGLVQVADIFRPNRFQALAIETIVNQLKEKDRPDVIHFEVPRGAGKTLLALALAQVFSNVVVIHHQGRNMYRELLKTIAMRYGINNIEILDACSLRGISVTNDAIVILDDFDSWTSDIKKTIGPIIGGSLEGKPKIAIRLCTSREINE